MTPQFFDDVTYVAYVAYVPCVTHVTPGYMTPQFFEAFPTVTFRLPSGTFRHTGYMTPQFFASRKFGWVENATTVQPTPSKERPIIELVTSPNNPDGHLRTPQLRGEHVRTLIDHAYLWPHFTPTAAPVAYGNDTIALFTLSKMTGHASTRIGCASRETLESARQPLAPAERAPTVSACRARANR